MVEWIKNNIATTISLLLAGIAILFTALKDFILPWFFKPKLEITYNSKEPYKKGPVIKNSGNMWENHERFKIENIGREIAKNARCQIQDIKNKDGKSFHLQGYHLKWASRPESAQDFSKVERLNIAPGESEFVDLIYMRTDNTTNFYFNKYPNIPTVIDDYLPIGDYTITTIISGDNFKPYFATFKINKKLDITGVSLHLKEVTRK